MGAENAKGRINRHQNLIEIEKIKNEAEKARQARSRTVQCEKQSRQGPQSLLTQESTITTKNVWGGKYLTNKSCNETSPQA